MKTYPSYGIFLVSSFALAATLTFSGKVSAADHRDAPGINEDPRADLNDVYAFVNPNNTNNVVLALTVNPLQVGGAPAVAFSPDVLYQFKIDNDGDAKEDLVIQATFTEPVPGPQQVKIVGPGAVKASGVSILNSVLRTNKVANFSGPANGTIFTNSSGSRAFAGLRDDPFFFDLIYVFRALGISTSGGNTNRAAGIDFFAGLNVSVLAVEFPASLLRDADSTNNSINVWATTSRPTLTTRSTKVLREDRNTKRFVQVDRMGKPALNTVLIHGTRKDQFNRATPSQDIALFGAEAIATLVSINGDTNYSTGLINGALFPDVLNLNLNSTDGYLNGREPEDDVIDITLNAASNGAITSDGVGANDVPFPGDFPFFAPPHAPEEVIPARN